MGKTQAKPPIALIVDDIRDNRELFRLALRQAGFESCDATNGVEALALLETRTFDLMILDLQMPHMNGATLLQTLRANEKFTALTVMVVTANPHMATTEVDKLADYIMYKPLEILEFIQLAQRLREKFAGPSSGISQPASGPGLPGPDIDQQA